MISRYKPAGLRAAVAIGLAVVLALLPALFGGGVVGTASGSSTARAASVNIAEDTFTRPNTAVGWGTTTNSDGVSNYTWGGMMAQSKAYISNNTGIVIYSGTNGHKVEGPINLPKSAWATGGDVLAEVSINVIGHSVMGVQADYSNSGNYYDATINTVTMTLSLYRRAAYTRVLVASVPFASSAGVLYWIRLDVQPNADGTNTEAARAWVDGTSEPTGWMVSYVDSQPLPAGEPGALTDWLRTPSVGEHVSFYEWAAAPAGTLAQQPTGSV